MNSKALSPCFVLVVLAAPLMVVAQGNHRCPEQSQITAVPNRPTFSTTAETVQCGIFEIEYGMEAADGHQDINGLLKFGASKNLELRFANLPLVRQEGVSAFGDVGVGFKYRFVSQHRLSPSVSVVYTTTLPTAGHDLGIGAIGHSIIGLVSKDFGKNHLDWNEGVIFAGRTGPTGGGFDHNYFSALDYTHPVSKNWAFVVEIAGFSRLNRLSPASMTLLGAATYNVSSRLVLDGGAYYGVFGNIRRVTGFAGVTYSVADLYHRHHGSQPRRRN